MKNYINEKSGIMSWLFTLDHKRIGIMYLVTIFAAFAIGGFAALALRFELLSPDKIILTAKQYNQAFTLHGAIMVLFIVPSIPATLGNFVLPLQIGANDVAFPRLNLASFHIYILGALFCITKVLSLDQLILGGLFIRLTQQQQILQLLAWSLEYLF